MATRSGGAAGGAGADGPGPAGSLTDVPGVRVGHAQRVGDGWLTGVTVVPTVDAVALTGGSAYGLVAAHGVQRWLAEQGRGFPVSDVPGEVVPIVPAAAVFDLGRGGSFGHHPDVAMGYVAAAAAGAAAPGASAARGAVGAGTGAALAGGRYRGGVGTASVRLPGLGVVVGALVVVNAAGAPVGLGAPASPPGGPLGPDGTPRVTPLPGDGAADPAGGPTPPALNTTLAVVATDAALDPAETSRTATAAHDGLARALDPVHTLADGDTVFALATGAVALPAERRARVAGLVAVQAAAATAVQAAVADAVRSATGVRTPAVHLPSWC